jgi:hypothetical protein
MSSKKTKPPFRNTLIILGCVAAFSIIFAGIAYWNIQSFLDTATKTKGKIIGFVPQRKVFRPVVQFMTITGDTIRFAAPIGSEDTLMVKTGSPVKVLYHHKSPQDATIDDFWYIWTNLIMILVFGISPLLFILFLRFVLVGKSN